MKDWKQEALRKLNAADIDDEKVARVCGRKPTLISFNSMAKVDRYIKEFSKKDRTGDLND